MLPLAASHPLVHAMVCAANESATFLDGNNGQGKQHVSKPNAGGQGMTTWPHTAKQSRQRGFLTWQQPADDPAGLRRLLIHVSELL